MTAPAGWIGRDRRFARAASFPAQGQAGHLSAHERRPVADGSVRLQAQDGRHVRQGPSRLDPQGPATDHDDQRPGPVPDRALEVQVRAARPVGHVDQRALALDGQARRPDRPGQDGLDRGDQSRPGGDLYLHGPSASGPAEPGRLAQLRPGHDESKPAGLRGDDRFVVEQGSRPGDLQPALGLGLSADQAPGRRAALDRRPGAVPVQPARRRCGDSQAHARRDRPAEPERVRSRSPTRRRRPGSPSTRWPSACRRPSPS